VETLNSLTSSTKWLRNQIHVSIFEDHIEYKSKHTTVALCV